MVKVINSLKHQKFFDRKLLKYYGINLFQQKKINCLFGLGSSGFITDLDKSFILKMELYIRDFYLLEDYLKMYILDNIENLINLKLYKGLRHKWKLPVNGQRTRTNSKTFRRLPRLTLQRYIHDIYKLK